MCKVTNPVKTDSELRCDRLSVALAARYAEINTYNEALNDIQIIINNEGAEPLWSLLSNGFYDSECWNVSSDGDISIKLESYFNRPSLDSLIDDIIALL